MTAAPRSGAIPEGRRDVLVVGGGLAGLSAATRLAEAGRAVTLLEGRGSLGGRTQSFVHAPTGDEVDTGQHVLLGCYLEMLRFLERIGQRHLVRFQESLEVALVRPGGPAMGLSCPRLPPPLHLAAGLFGHGMLSLAEKLGTIRVVRDARARWESPALDGMTVTQWLTRLGQTDNVRDALWTPLCLACLNASPDVAPASLMAVVIVKGLLSPGRGSSIGLATVGLSTLHAEASTRYVEDRGGEVVLNQPVLGLVVEHARAAGVRLRDGQVLRAREIVAAVPGPALHAMLPDPLRGQRPFDALPRFGPSPIVSVHLWLDRPVIDTAFVGFVGTDLHWAFDRARTWGTPARGGHLLTLVVSGADRFAAMEAEDVLAACRADLDAAIPAARQARVLHWKVVKEKSATFRAVPGMAALRFGPETPLPGLHVAGDWTDTGLPATMEGACASGHAAAERVLAISGP